MWVYLARNLRMMQVKNKESDIRKDSVEEMFDSIAHHYDFLNHFLSFGVDRFWRRRAIRIISEHIKPERILDVATGTGDLAIASLKLKPSKVTGIDISEAMLSLGRKKLRKKGLTDRIELLKGNSETIEFPEATFDVAMSAFGVRNFGDTLKGLTEMNRVLRKGGMIMILEFSRPAYFPLKHLFNFYFTRILPWLGKSISGDKGAYSYLPDSVMHFPDNEDFMMILHLAGFNNEHQLRLSGGIASIYYAFKV